MPDFSLSLLELIQSALAWLNRHAHRTTSMQTTWIPTNLLLQLGNLLFKNTGPLLEVDHLGLVEEFHFLLNISDLLSDVGIFLVVWLPVTD